MLATRAQMDPRAVMAWAESGDGVIARGIVDGISAEGASVTLDADLNVGDEVAIRLAFEPGGPTLPASGRIVSVRPSGLQRQYALEWTCDGTQREALEARIARLAAEAGI